jgi:hypothetical protein
MTRLARFLAALAVLRGRAPVAMPAIPSLPGRPVAVPLPDLAAQRAVLQAKAEVADAERTAALAAIAKLDSARATLAKS